MSPLNFCPVVFLLTICFFQRILSQNYTRSACSPTIEKLLEGKNILLDDGFKSIPSVTLIQDFGYKIIVDTPTSGDEDSKKAMLKVLKDRQIDPCQIGMVVTTHGHPDHYGYLDLFKSASNYFGNFKINGPKFVPTDFSKDKMLLTPCVELWKTPGHTLQDISAIVYNVADYGTVAVIGDLLSEERDVLNPEAVDNRAENARMNAESRKLVVCAADYIIPGHNEKFKVTSEMRSAYNCSTGGNSTDQGPTTNVTNNCLNGGTFHLDSAIKQYKCYCRALFWGARCEKPFCMNYGMLNTTNSTSCSCPDGFSGMHCENGGNATTSTPSQCFNGGTLMDGKCLCYGPYWGNECEKPMCANYGLLNNNDSCVCGGNYSGYNCQNGNGTVTKAILYRGGNRSLPVGEILFKNYGNGSSSVEVSGRVGGLSQGLHGFHIHSSGQINASCSDTGSHFNPFALNHGGPNDTSRHVGDLGNIDSNGENLQTPVGILDSQISLNATTEAYIVGRAVVVHEGEDDLGKGANDTDTLTTGNAGQPYACGTIVEF